MSHQYFLIYSENFLRDLKEIHYYIAKVLCAPTSADKIVHRIYSAAESLAFMPRRFAVVQDSLNRQDEKRRAPCGNYGIYYKVIEDKLSVHVLRVIRRGRNVEDLLKA